LGIYLCFWIHKYTTFISTSIFQSFTFVKWNEIVSFIISCPGCISNIICKILWKSFKSLRWDTLKHTHLWKVVQCDKPKRPKGGQCNVLSPHNLTFDFCGHIFHQYATQHKGIGWLQINVDQFQWIKNLFDSVKIVIYCDIIACTCRNIVNELIKITWIKAQLYDFLKYMLKEKKNVKTH